MGSCRINGWSMLSPINCMRIEGQAFREKKKTGGMGYVRGLWGRGNAAGVDGMGSGAGGVGVRREG